MLVSLAEIRTLAKTSEEFRRGCILDTNVIFAASFPLDAHNEWAEKVVHELHAAGIPIFSNINVRSEYLDLNRRVLIPEGLMDFFRDYEPNLPGEVAMSLKALRTRMDRANLESRTFKLSDSDIKRYRQLLSKIGGGIDGRTSLWDEFCEEYLLPYISSVWTEVVQSLRLEFLGTRAIENRENFNHKPNWERVIEIIGRSGIGSADAMIVNLFLASKLPLIVTADSDVKETLLGMTTGPKYVLAI